MLLISISQERRIGSTQSLDHLFCRTTRFRCACQAPVDSKCTAPRRVANGGRNLPPRAWVPMPATDGNTRHKELASCEGGAGKEMGSDEDKDLPFGSAHTQTNTDITGEEREREPLFKITTLSQPAPPHCSLSLSLSLSLSALCLSRI